MKHKKKSRLAAAEFLAVLIVTAVVFTKGLSAALAWRGYGRMLKNLLGRQCTFCGVAGTQARRFLQLRRAEGGVTNGIFC